MATLTNSELVTHPSGTTGLNAVINGNWEQLEDIFKHDLGTGDNVYLLIAKALLRENLASAAAGDTLFWGTNTTTKFKRRPAIGSTSGTPIALAFNYGLLAPIITLSMSADTTWSAVTNPIAGQQVTVVITNNATPHNFTWNGAWTWVGAAAPASIAGSKKALLKLTATTTADSGIIAEYTVQA